MYKQEVSNLYSIIPEKARSKREAWIPIIGQALKIGFGTLTTQDFNKLHKEISKVSSNLDDTNTQLTNGLLYVKTWRLK